MRKEILITNYYPAKLKESRELSGLSIEDVENEGIIEAEQLLLMETEQPVTPIDIFILGSLLNLYEEKSTENGKEKLEISLTSDIMFPHPNGLKYQEDIVAHANYKGFPFERNAQGNINWMTTIKTQQGQARMKFWKEKLKYFKLKATSVMAAGFRQKVAFVNHPFKQHVCLFTGNVLFIDYRYPAPSRIDLINKGYDEAFKYYDLDILQLASVSYENDECKIFSDVFNVSIDFNSLPELIEHLQKEYIDKEKRGYVSPGVMSNSPDRLDGFHSYNSDVRDVCDTGRRKENLKRYTQDRRVYEKWSDGDWKMSDRLYAEFVKNGVSPDHIGPMSLGFAHRPRFHPMTSGQNSSKGNRMTLKDVRVLIADEEKGEVVVSWHSKFIWNKLKHNVKVDEDALKLSSLMRKNLHHVLILLSILYEKGYRKFLEGYLNPKYSYFDYKFEGFDPLTGNYKKVLQKELTGKNQQNNVDRYYRIAFETLLEYMTKENRKGKIWKSQEIDTEVAMILEPLASNRIDEAKEQVTKVLRLLADLAANNW
jgi:Alw26I/Eco31I/Esp3I family type II restriction endonuclease